MKKILLIILLVLPVFVAAQESRLRGEVFKRRPDTPGENINKTGLIVVERTMYGLIFEDISIPEEAKNKVKRFFALTVFRNEYQQFKTYRLKVERQTFDHSKWTIEGVRIDWM